MEAAAFSAPPGRLLWLLSCSIQESNTTFRAEQSKPMQCWVFVVFAFKRHTLYETASAGRCREPPFLVPARKGEKNRLGEDLSCALPRTKPPPQDPSRRALAMVLLSHSLYMGFVCKG